jgi:hypothetical protein
VNIFVEVSLKPSDILCPDSSRPPSPGQHATVREEHGASLGGYTVRGIKSNFWLMILHYNSADLWVVIIKTFMRLFYFAMVISMGVWQWVTMDSLKYHSGLPYPTLLRPVSRPP